MIIDVTDNKTIIDQGILGKKLLVEIEAVDLHNNREVAYFDL